MSSAILLLAAASLAAADEAAADLARFDGNWVMVAYTVDGKEASPQVARSIKLTVKGGVSTFTIGSETSMGKYRLDPAKRPKWIDISITSGPEKGTTRLGIYEFTGQQLRVCHGLKNRPKEFASKPGSGHVLEIWKKAK